MDLTERKQAEEKRQRVQADLPREPAQQFRQIWGHFFVHATRVMTLGEMTTSMAHAINQPLAAVALTANACLR